MILFDMGGMEDNILYRHSFVKDYMRCPAMCALKHMVQIGDSKPPVWFSSLMGTACHKLASYMHESRNFKMSAKEIHQSLADYFKEAIDESDSIPHVSKKHGSVRAQFISVLPEYSQIMMGYQNDPRNSTFNVVLNEQRFVFKIYDDVSGSKFMFTGQIDQFGIDARSRWCVRDLKLRDMTYYPSVQEQMLDIQTAIYSHGIVNGDPACDNCKPRYVSDVTSNVKTLAYNGMCDNCEKQKDSWPDRFPDICSTVWLRSYQRRKKDQYSKYSTKTDKTKPKIRNERGNLVYQKALNPAYAKGYKEGECVGEAMIESARSEVMNKVLMSDVLSVCRSIRRGEFHRRPSDHCVSSCSYRKSCSESLQDSITQNMDKMLSGFEVEPDFSLDGNSHSKSDKTQLPNAEFSI